jgi:prepilin-type N-terminal cleavage/methylation domain-containing protein
MTLKAMGNIKATWLSRRAFTVIELTVTLTILAVIFLAVHGVLARTLSSSQKAEKANRRATISDAILRRMTADLRSAFMASTHEVCFKGDAESLHFVTSVESLAKVGQETSTFNSVGYVLGRNDKSSSVFRLFRRENRGKVDLTEGEYRELYPYVGSIKFEYLKKMDGEDDKDAVQVKEDWDSVRDRGLPLAVQMELTLFFPDATAAISLSTFGEMEGRRYRAVFKIPAGGYYIANPDLEDKDEPATNDTTKETGQSSN